MTTGFKVLLAPNDDPMRNPEYFNKLRFPLLASPKLDGIRCVIKEGQCKSRKYITIPSGQANSMFGAYDGLDGELVVGSPTDYGVYNRTQSYVMSHDKHHPDLRFWVFDWAMEDLLNVHFEDRLFSVHNFIKELNDPFVKPVIHQMVNNLEELLEFEADALDHGYEGIMMRDPHGRYKQGRGTFREGIIYKLKRFQDDEAIVTGFVEQMMNLNPDVRDNLGHAKRSSSQENLIPANTLGKFIVEYSYNGEKLDLEIPPGILTHPQRKLIWDYRKQYIGKILKFRYFPHGIKDKPRQPRFIGWRDEADL